MNRVYRRAVEMEVSTAARRRWRKSDAAPTAAKCLSSTYRSFRDSDASLFHLTSSSSLMRSKSFVWPSASASTADPSDNPLTSSSTELSSCESSDSGGGRGGGGTGWPLVVHRCLRTLNHRRWLQHWRELLSSTLH